MPIELFERDGILHIVYSGTVTREEFADPARGGGGQDREITFNDVLRFADGRRTRRFKNPFKAAALAYDPVTMGLAEMYQALNDNPQTTIQVFVDRDTALRWLAD